MRNKQRRAEYRVQQREDSGPKWSGPGKLESQGCGRIVMRKNDVPCPVLTTHDIFHPGSRKDFTEN